MSAGRNKHRVLVIGPVGAVGGMATSMRLQLGSSLAKQYELIPFDNSKRTPANRSSLEGAMSQLQLMYELMAQFRRCRPDLVHIHTCSGLTFYRTIIDLWIARLNNTGVLLHIRGGRFADFLKELSTFNDRLVRWALTSADCVIAVSPTWAERISQFDPAIRTCVVLNGVVLPKRAKTWRKASSLRGSPTLGSRTRIVFVGPLKQSKGIEDLIKAVAKLPKKLRMNLEVRAIGPDPQSNFDTLNRLTQDLGVGQVFVFTGQLSPEKVQRELMQASVFTLPSYVEALPNALLEAMACGLPSVVSDVGAIPEVIDDGQEGFLVPPGDIVKLTKRLRKLLEDFELRKQMGRASRKRARRDFSQQQVSRRLDHLYSQTLAQRKD